MKNRGNINKISAIFLTAAMIGVMLPKFSTPVFAQNTTNDNTNKTTYSTLPTENAVAKVGNDYYSNIQEAINASSEQFPAILLKDVTVTGINNIRPKDGAVLNTNGFTLSFDNKQANIIMNPNHKFTINGCGNIDKPDLIIGEIFINPISEGEDIDLNKGLYLNNAHIKKADNWYYSLLSNMGHMVLTDCIIDAYPMYGEITNRNIALFITGYTELNGYNTIIGDIKLDNTGTILNNGQSNIIDGVIQGYISQPERLRGCKGDFLSTVVLPDNWEWINPNQIMNPENEFIPTMTAKAKYLIQDDYDYSHYEGYNKDGNYVIMELGITLLNRNEWIINPSISDWIYGEEANTPIGQALHGNVEFSYKSETGEIFTDIPTEPGHYLMKAYVEKQFVGFEEYKEMEVIIPFTIHKKTPTVTLPNNIIAFEGDKLSDVSLPDGFTWKDINQTVNNSGEYDAIYTPNDTKYYKTLEVKISIFMHKKPLINIAPTIKEKDIVLIVGDKFDPLKDVTATDYEDGNITLTKNHIIKNTVNTSKKGVYEVIYKITDSDGATLTKTIKVTVLEAIKDKETLENVIKDTTSNVNKKDYTKESYNAYLNALEKAKAILKDPNATKDDIARALANLKASYKGLQKANVTTPNTSNQTNVYLYTLTVIISGLALVILALNRKIRKLN